MHDPVRRRLHVLQREVAQRAQAMEHSHGAWPCRSGCDHCCRRLGALPSLTAVEFEDLDQAVQRLPAAVRHEVHARVAALQPDAQGHWTCPLLDLQTGRCRVYDARPIACRTYGFFSGRDGDYWCERVTDHLGGRRVSLVAGNQVAVDRQRDHDLGPSTDLVTLFARTAADR